MATSRETSETDAAARWRWLLRVVLILLIGVGVLVHVYVQVPIPPIIVFFVLFGVALYLLSRDGRAQRAGVILGGVAAVLFLLGNLGIVMEDLAHPDSVLAFLASGASVVGAILGLVAMLGVLLRWSPTPVRPLAGLGALAVVVIGVVGLIATLGVDSDRVQAGDVVLIAEDVDFVVPGEDPEREDEAAITVARGGAVFVTNKDLYRHTFTMEGTDIDEEVQASADRRVVIDAAPGEYEFLCDVTGHEDDMKGTLTVR